MTTHGQVTIPIKIREQLGLHPGSEVEFEVDGDEVRLGKAEGTSRRGRTLVGRMRGSATTRLTTDEIMALTRS